MRIGIDLGGTKIAGVALDGDGAEIARRRAPTPRGDYPATLRAIAGLVAAIESETGRRGSVGVGIPGAESLATGRVKNANSVWLIGQPLADDLAAALGRPVRLANDANCFALSEAVDGAAAGAGVVFGVILGTGVGGGIVVGGRVLAGVNAVAGEWGHNPLPWPGDGERPGPSCYCGLEGCIETFLSGPGLVRDYASGGPSCYCGLEGCIETFLSGPGLVRDYASGGGGTESRPADIAALADRGDAPAAAALERYADRLARALATVINTLDPDVIVLGGGVSNIAALYDTVPARWNAHVFSDQVDTRLVRARFGDASGVRGAAWLWPAKAAGAEERVPVSALW